MDNILDFLTGKSAGKHFCEVRFACKLQETGEGGAVQVKVQAKAHLMWVNLHNSMMDRSQSVARSRNCIFLVLGPSNSQKNIFCQVPSCSRPLSIMTVSDEPISDAMMCEGEFPSW